MAVHFILCSYILLVFKRYKYIYIYINEKKRKGLLVLLGLKMTISFL